MGMEKSLKAQTLPALVQAEGTSQDDWSQFKTCGSQWESGHWLRWAGEIRLAQFYACVKTQWFSNLPAIIMK